MADKEITPKDPQATEVVADEERGEADRKTQKKKVRFRLSGRKTSGFKAGR